MTDLREESLEEVKDSVDTEFNFRESLITTGLNSVMRGWTESERYLKSIILKHYPEMLHDNLSKINQDLQVGIVYSLYQENPDALVTEEFWKNYIDEVYDTLSDKEDIFYFKNAEWYLFINRVKDFRDKQDWFEILVNLGKGMVAGGGSSKSFFVVLDWMTSADNDYLKKLLYRTETKNYPKEVKRSLYKRIIDFKLLDVKIARRIRSDSSGELSADILSYLFEKKNLYGDEKFQELVTQFVDTKHKWVARYIALNMPLNLVPFLMGITDKFALKILDKRIQLSEDS